MPHRGGFLTRAMSMLSSAGIIAVIVCLSVWPSVRHTSVFYWKG